MAEFKPQRVSISQIFAEVFCRDTHWEYEDRKQYSNMGYRWNQMSSEARHEVVEGVKRYLTERLGSALVED